MDTCMCTYICISTYTTVCKCLSKAWVPILLLCVKGVTWVVSAFAMLEKAWYVWKNPRSSQVFRLLFIFYQPSGSWPQGSSLAASPPLRMHAITIIISWSWWEGLGTHEEPMVPSHYIPESARVRVTSWFFSPFHSPFWEKAFSPKFIVNLVFKIGHLPSFVF